ncbi:MAG: pilus assembly protein PilM [Candidatus Sumerlaeota bacterium]|nr:pilus assembly protein PilM [Candidatus Sumerlaeota bacterium]
MMADGWRITRVVRGSGGWSVIDRIQAPFEALPEDETERPAAKGDALKAALKRHKIKITEARLCIPKNDVTVRYRRLPPSESEAELAQMARFEAERHIPFNPQRHLIDYYVMGRAPLAGVDVLTVSVDGPVVEETLEACTRAGIDVALADVSSLALYRLYQMRARSAAAPAPASAPEAAPAASAPAEVEASVGVYPSGGPGAQAATAGPSGAAPGPSGSGASATALLHVGKNSMDMVLINQGILLFARSANIGVQALLGAEGFEAPEHLAKLDATEAAPPGGIAAGALRPWLGRLVQEMRRTYEFAYREFSCPPIGEILISGMGMRVGRLGDFLAREFNAQVEPLLSNLKPPVHDATRAVRSAKTAEEKAALDPLDDDAIAIGAALDNPEGAERRVNLLPEAWLRKRRRQSQTTAILTSSLLAACLIALGVVYFNQINANRKMHLALLQKYIRDNAQRVREINDMEFKIGVFDEYRNPKKSALHILEYICSLPITQSNVRLTAFNFSQGLEIKIAGNAMSLAHVNEFVGLLRKSPYFTKVEILKHEPMRLPRRMVDIYDFDLRCIPVVTEKEKKSER